MQPFYEKQPGLPTQGSELKPLFTDSSSGERLKLKLSRSGWIRGKYVAENVATITPPASLEIALPVYDRDLVITPKINGKNSALICIDAEGTLIIKQPKNGGMAQQTLFHNQENFVALAYDTEKGTWRAATLPFVPNTPETLEQLSEYRIRIARESGKSELAPQILLQPIRQGESPIYRLMAYDVSLNATAVGRAQNLPQFDFVFSEVDPKRAQPPIQPSKQLRPRPSQVIEKQPGKRETKIVGERALTQSARELLEEAGYRFDQRPLHELVQVDFQAKNGVALTLSNIDLRTARRIFGLTPAPSGSTRPLERDASGLGARSIGFDQTINYQTRAYRGGRWEYVTNRSPSALTNPWTTRDASSGIILVEDGDEKFQGEFVIEKYDKGDYEVRLTASTPDQLDRILRFATKGMRIYKA